MKNIHPKKFALIGLPGSGKSTFASKLGRILSLPVHHLDRHMFEPDGKKRDKREFIETQKALLEETAWIVEGCSFSTFEMRFAKADILIYFHFSRAVCFWRFFKRIFNYKREFGGLRAITWELLKYTWNFDKEKRARIAELRDKYPQTDFLVFRTQKDADFFLRQSSERHLSFAKRNKNLKKISIRDYHPDDVQALANIYFNTIHKINIQHYTKEQIDVWAPATSLETEGWAKKFSKTKPIIATVGDEIVGFAEFKPNGHIDCFYCHHEWIGKGVGSALMKEILQKAKNCNIPLIFAEVSITAKPFFEKWRFRIVAEQTIARKGVELINFKMERETDKSKMK